MIVQSKTLHRHNKIITPRVSAVLHRARRIQPISKYVIHNQQGKKILSHGHEGKLGSLQGTTTKASVVYIKFNQENGN